MREREVTNKPINLIQDVATPHNNVLIKAFIDSQKGDKIRLWYAQDEDRSRYQWSKNITQEHCAAEIYSTSLNWRFIRYCLAHPHDRYVIVGWANANTRLLHLLFFFLRRPYNHWTDLPSVDTRPIGFGKKVLRWAAYKVLLHSKSKVFCVGIAAMERLRNLGFPDERLANLPIFVESQEDLPVYYARKEEIFARYALSPHHFILSAGSRIIHEKGYDLLIRAISLLSDEIRHEIKAVIVGSGPCVSDLEELIKELGLSDQIILEKWLAIEDFKALIANSHVFVHPARLDSYGGTTLGMVLGVPVIGSYSAGAATDRIVHGRNGFLYEAEDIRTLAGFIQTLYRNPDLRKQMGAEALKTAQAWPPSRGAGILVENAI